MPGRWWGVVAASDVPALATAVACQRDGTTVLSVTRDHLGVLASIVGRRSCVNVGAPVGVSLAVGRAFDDEGVGA